MGVVVAAFGIAIGVADFSVTAGRSEPTSVVSTKYVNHLHWPSDTSTSTTRITKNQSLWQAKTTY